MEWLDRILEGIENADEISARIRGELPKNFIPKEKYNVLAQSKRELEEKIDSDIAERLCDVAVNASVKSLSGEFKVRDTDVVKMLIDKKAISVGEDGSVNGLDEQINLIRKEKPFLFGAEPLAGRTPFMGGADSPNVTKEQFKSMGYRERIKLFEEQPEMYKNLNN